MIEKKPILLPFPKLLILQDGFMSMKDEAHISISVFNGADIQFPVERLEGVITQILKIGVEITDEKNAQIVFLKNTSLPEQGYNLLVTKHGIKIEYNMGEGALYAVSTLKQLIVQFGAILPCLIIEDAPDFKRRGIMLDISRDKIPSMETLYNFIDFMADIKLNELQLYIEGFSFAYPSYPEVWKNGTPITPEEMIRLDFFCRERNIDLVPNQNSFGHMAPWLEREEFAHLAECPEGCLTPWGTLTRNTTLNPLDEDSIRLVKSLYRDLVPNFTSEYFNVGLDEPFELGHGKSKAAVKSLGEGRVYLEYLLKIYNEVNTLGRRMMFWGDIIIKHPELIAELPSNIIALEWGYEADHPFKDNCKKYRNAGIDFYVCPGTSSWCSILGRTDNMVMNLLNAAENGISNGAIGFLNTDWGDMGHIQYLPVSYPSFSFGAAISWGVKENKDIDFSSYLNRFVYKDKSGLMAELAFKLGNYYLFEKKMRSNGTGIFDILNSNPEELTTERLAIHDNYADMEQYLLDLLGRINIVQMDCEDAELILDEYRNGTRYVLHGLKRIRYAGSSSEEREKLRKELLADIESIMENHSRLWLRRNRPGGLERSLEYMKKLKAQYE
ncbi:MAG: family 20 glycosylhydrolase [Bacillota bacterium]|nr:family 20 glycosylhydrolase [Bacillota bacterium]